MRTLSIIVCCLLILSSCKKDKYTTAPQIEFKSINPNAFYSTSLSPDGAPVLTISITDANGDLGLTNSDTSRIFLKNLLSNNIDSFNFPNLGLATKKNFKAEVSINLFNALDCAGSGPRPRVDTTYYEVYVQDFAKHKSNVIVTNDPVYYICE